MNKRFTRGAVCLLIFCAGLLYTCTKQGTSASVVPPNQQKVSLYLTDGPGFFDSVFIDIKTVSVVVDTCAHPGDDNHDGGNHDGGNHDGEGGDDGSGPFDSPCKVHDTIAFNAGVYNLAQLRNGVDTILASGDIPKGKIKYIIVTLGAKNYLVKDGIQYPLNLFAGTDSRIIIKLSGDEFETTGGNINSLWLDFDVERSIFRLWDGKFYLRPLIRIFAEEKSGGLRGNVSPRDAFPVISVYNNQDTLYALPNLDGNFYVRGLPTGSYTVFINASNGYKDTTITNVNVTMGNKTDIGEIKLTK